VYAFPPGAIKAGCSANKARAALATIAEELLVMRFTASKRLLPSATIALRASI